ncbi:MAG: sugar ABC transporter permease [Tissierellia bacterium]|jgi:raffinose/stachyose/melibiose transport system permease protein|nr:sugar ABC transporter permease [Bacillota bacterium]NLL23468.1 sugar ABC transporter permease [Tissierellia bacterium]
MKLYGNKKTALLFIAPALLFVLLFIYYPIVQNFFMSLYRWKAFGEDRIWVGLQYYRRIAQDPVFYTALTNNFLYALISIVFQVGFGLVIAAILEETFFRRFQGFFRTVFFMPSVISITVVGLLFQLIYHPSIGLLNNFLKAIGLENLTRAWLGESGSAMYAIIASSQWQYIGYIMLLFLVAIQKIPKELYESAEMDGAGAFQRFIHITVPQVKETIIMNSIITVIGGFKVFDEVYVMTAGGPGRSTEVLATFLYRSGFRNDEMGMASAIASIIFVITFVLTLVQLYINRKIAEE